MPKGTKSVVFPLSYSGGTAIELGDLSDEFPGSVSLSDACPEEVGIGGEGRGEEAF